VLRKRDDRRIRVVGGAGDPFAHRGECLFAGARDEQRRAAPNNLAGDGGNLVGRLAQAEDDLGEALTHGAMVIDTSEAEIRVWLGPEGIEYLAVGRGRIDLASCQLLEQIQELFV